MAVLQFFNVWHLSGVLNSAIRSGFKAFYNKLGGT